MPDVRHLHMQYLVVYDVLHDRIAPELWLGLLFGLAVVTALAIIPRKQPLLRRLGLALVAVAWVGIWSAIIYGQHLALSSCRQLLQGGAARVVEGTVQDFVPMPSGGHASERFTVNGVPFSYSDFDLSHCGFRNAASHGGPIRSGLAVRITYVGSSILRLEVAAP